MVINITINHPPVRRGTSRKYVLERLKRERPDFFERVKAKELSANRAAILAGWRKESSPLDRLRADWKKASESERALFRQEILTSAHSRPVVGNSSRRPRNAVKLPPGVIQLMSAAAPENHRPRRAGSARFSTYFKVQYWDARNCAWHDVQKQHATREAARAAYPKARRCRTMEISPAGRRPL